MLRGNTRFIWALDNGKALSHLYGALKKYFYPLFPIHSCYLWMKPGADLVLCYKDGKPVLQEALRLA